MNPLEALKDKLRAKPTLEERKKIAIVVKGEIEAVPGIKIIPQIVDESQQYDYPRQELLERLGKSAVSRVIIKPVLKASKEESKDFEEMPTNPKKARKISKKKLKIIDEAVEPVLEEVDELQQPEEVIKIKRRTKKVEKGVAVLGPETLIEFNDKRLPKKLPPVIIKASSYYMNNRELFVNFINSLFEPYRKEIQDNEENISCDTIGVGDFSLLTHQKIVRDYINLHTPYRGLLLYHGLGSGKTCTSIAIAEGMKDSKKVIIMTPASLRTNYMEELKKCGDSLYRKNQFWEWISTNINPDAEKPISDILNLPIEYIKKKKGAWFVNVQKASNYDTMSSIDKKSLDDQLDEMIRNKYTFINYNGLRLSRLKELTNDFTKNIFDNAVIIIDEAHNLISRIVNKIKKEKAIPENKKGEKERAPVSLASKLYEFLLSANNAKIVLLSGTPVINYPNEFGILFNILRGYIKTWKIPLKIKTSAKVDKNYLQEKLLGEKTIDYLDYSPTSRILTITRNPYGFKNKIKPSSGYQGVSNEKKNEEGSAEVDFLSDDDFEKRIVKLLLKLDIELMPEGITIQNKKALPDSLDYFQRQYIDPNTDQLINTESLKHRIIGLSSYFRSAQENLLPKYDELLGTDYHIVKLPMSDLQFKIYESARVKERMMEKKKPSRSTGDDIYEEKSSTYRIFSRLFCNFVMPDRPYPVLNKQDKEDKEDKEEKDDFVKLLREANKTESKFDLNDINEGEIEGDDVLDKLGGITYKEQIDLAIKNIQDNSNDFLTPESLEMYSPKFLAVLENIQDPDYQGLHLVYSQFRTIEGIGIFSLVLEKNGFARFKLKRSSANSWDIDINEEDIGKPTYALYTGTETAEEKEIIRNIYNGDWNYIPTNIANKLKLISNNNNMGEIIKVLMITSSGSEGINLRNTRYVHLMEPYWHPVRSQQVIGRARRICSHKNLPEELQTVEVFVYLMTFTKEQAESDDAKELRLKDLSKRGNPRVPITSDEYLYEISDIKKNLTDQLMTAIKESAFDCYIYSPDGKCFNFASPTKDSYAYLPDYTEEQTDVGSKLNKQSVKWDGKTIKLQGKEYAYIQKGKDILHLYELKSFKSALADPSIVPVQIGTLELKSDGNHVFKQVA
jgi:hypothetical protein